MASLMTTVRDAMSLLDQVIAWAGPGTPVTLAKDTIGESARETVALMKRVVVRGGRTAPVTL